METPGRGVSWVQAFKFFIIGDADVGKSCLLLQFTEQKFRPELDPTIGFESSLRIVDIDGKCTKLQIWDTSCQELQRSITKPYYRGTAAAILVYDITRRETFDRVESWLKDAVEVAPPNLTTILVGNKCDLSDRRAVSYEEGESFAKAHGLFFMESSAKMAHNVEEAFTVAARTVSRKIEDGVLDSSAKMLGQDLSSRTQIFKFITIGDSGVGKSCLLLQFTDRRFRSELDPTIGCDCGKRTVKIDGKPTRLQIWGTAGQELYRSVNKSYYRRAVAAILVYDITRRETFDHVAWWLKDAMEVVPALTTILIGNKCDLSDRRTVSYEEGESFAKMHGLFFMESSAKTAHNVEEAFTMIARIVSKKIEDGALNQSAKLAGWKPFAPEVPRGGSCCS